MELYLHSSTRLCGVILEAPETTLTFAEDNRTKVEGLHLLRKFLYLPLLLKETKTLAICYSTKNAGEKSVCAPNILKWLTSEHLLRGTGTHSTRTLARQCSGMNVDRAREGTIVLLY
jgi:hypothetical protein